MVIGGENSEDSELNNVDVLDLETGARDCLVAPHPTAVDEATAVVLPDVPFTIKVCGGEDPFDEEVSQYNRTEKCSIQIIFLTYRMELINVKPFKIMKLETTQFAKPTVELTNNISLFENFSAVTTLMPALTAGPAPGPWLRRGTTRVPPSSTDNG